MKHKPVVETKASALLLTPEGVLRSCGAYGLAEDLRSMNTNVKILFLPGQQSSAQLVVILRTRNLSGRPPQMGVPVWAFLSPRRSFSSLFLSLV
jgi:hypothetical protein